MRENSEQLRQCHFLSRLMRKTNDATVAYRIWFKGGVGILIFGSWVEVIYPKGTLLFLYKLMLIIKQYINFVLWLFLLGYWEEIFLYLYTKFSSTKKRNFCKFCCVNILLTRCSELFQWLPVLTWLQVNILSDYEMGSAYGLFVWGLVKTVAICYLT